jgi:hypothetical protein
MRIAMFLIAFPIASVAIAAVSEEKLAKQVRDRTGLYSWNAVSGSLKPDNKKYIAALVSKDESAARVEAQLVVFEQDDRRSPVIKSMPFTIGDRVSWEPTIDKGSLFFHGDGSCGAVCHGSTNYQFQLRDGEFRLIGVEELTVSAISDSDELTLSTSGKSVNLLAGKIIFYDERCRTVEDDPWNCKSKKKVTKKLTSFIPNRSWTIQQFGPDEFVNYSLKTKPLNGYIDGNQLKFFDPR